MQSPYTDLPPRQFWKTGVAEAHPLTVTDLYRKKFPILPSHKIATAGSCFAQHVANYLRMNAFQVMDVEPAPSALGKEEALAFGYGIYSARYGNIYTVRQLLQLARDAEAGAVYPEEIWTKDDRYFDALRPNVEVGGFESPDEVLALRRDHLTKVQRLFAEMDILIFTLGLTEAWVNRSSGRVYPVAPGTIAGSYNPDIFAFKNFSYEEIRDDFEEFYTLLMQQNPGVKILLTVSPVPLTATATDNHVLTATMYSKSVLRSVAGALAEKHENIDYFPSYEMVASPWSKGFFYEANMRSVNTGGVAAVMRVFFDAHGAGKADAGDTDNHLRQDRRNDNGDSRRERKERRQKRKELRRENRQTDGDDVVCEELLVEAFAP